MKALFGFLIFAGILYGIYSGVMAIWSYFEISNVVEEVVPRELPKLSDRGSDRSEDMRNAIVKGAEKAGIALDPATVNVSEEGSAIWVRINATYPVLRFRDKKYFDIPISTAHSFGLKP